MDHFREAEKLIEQAESWEDADYGWRASLSSRERIDRRKADFLGAIAHGIAGVLEAMQHTPINLTEPTGGVRVPVWSPPMRDDRQDQKEATS